MNDYISKPFTLNELSEKLAQWLDNKQHMPPIIITFKEADIIQTGSVIEKKHWKVIQDLQRPDQPKILHKLINEITHEYELVETELISEINKNNE